MDQEFQKFYEEQRALTNLRRRTRKPRAGNHPRPNEGRGNLPKAERKRRPVVTKRRTRAKISRKSRQINRK